MERINRVGNENIIIVRNNVKVTPELVEENRARVRELMQDMDGKVVLIIDYTDGAIGFQDVVGIIKGYSEGKRKDLNEKTFSIFVGTDTFVDMIRNAIRQPQFGGVDIPFFDSVEMALEVARIYLVNSEQNPNE